MKLRLKNYRSIQDVSLDFEGITIIRGQNDSGKSDTMRALRMVLNNASGDSHVRHGSSKLEVDLGLGDRSLHYERKRGGSPLVILDNNTDSPLEKLGRLTLSDIDPSFPLRVLNFGDERFMPNFVFQKETPVFGQVDVYAFFAAMFDPVAQLSRRNLALRTEVTGMVKETNAIEATVASLMSDELEARTVLSTYDLVIDKIEHKAALAAVELMTKLNEIDTQVASLSPRLASAEALEEALNVDFTGAAEGLALVAATSKAMSLLDATNGKYFSASSRNGISGRIADGLAVNPKESWEAARKAQEAFSARNHAVSRLDAATTRQRCLEPISEAVSHRDQVLSGEKSLHAIRMSIARKASVSTRLAALSEFVSQYPGVALERFLAVHPALSSMLELSRKQRTAVESLKVNESRSAAIRSELIGMASCPLCGSTATESLKSYLGG